MIIRGFVKLLCLLALCVSIAKTRRRSKTKGLSRYVPPGSYYKLMSTPQFKSPLMTVKMKFHTLSTETLSLKCHTRLPCDQYSDVKIMDKRSVLIASYCNQLNEISKIPEVTSKHAMTIEFNSGLFRQGHYDCTLEASRSKPGRKQMKTPPKKKYCSFGRNRGRRSVGPRLNHGDVPWHVGIGVVTGSGFSLICSGALVSNNYILSAAHCFLYEAFNLTIMLGSVNMNNEEAILLKPITIVVHENFTRENRNNDIALVKVNAANYINYYIRPVCLPTGLISYDYAEADVMVSGYGHLSYNRLTNPPRLRTALYDKMKDSHCVTAWGNDIITNNTFCTLPKYLGSCEGDAGAPVTVVIRGRTYIVGVISYGAACGQPNSPIINTKVTEYLSWISHNTEEQICSQ